ncbi:glycosyl transferase [Pseudorhizobium endolithicum]|uniref:Glycosyl transferase n=1 Tax=Pseudorhizobium endolithicum TaxID=1191678 RepID=A0ABN7JXE7_9HYPH|nr:glycosyl transferase [Pseudorhizobium endolithicum]CAD6423065.1 glycosyl transferase [Rhizobium sp. Q54]CAD7053113.1 glycosyl transferase [Pseudorhizobium endolithicum]
MLTVMIETRNQEAELAQTLSGLVSAAVEGLVAEVVVLDHASSDGSARVADAAGCRFLAEWDIAEVLASARGDWILLVEPGARFQKGWIDEVLEYVALNQAPARFSPARGHKRPFLKRMVAKTPPLEHGLLLTKRQALSAAQSGLDLTRLKAVRLTSELIPARSLRVAG